MNTKIPVTIITGFLGSGKTTLMNSLLHKPHNENIAIIINEFGDIGMDHHFVLDTKEEIFQMNNGCLCCSMRTDLAEMLHSILTVKQEQNLVVDRIIIETTGLAEPAPIAQTFIRTPFLQESFYLDSILAVVDAENAIYQFLHYEEALEQVAFSDKLLLSKTELVDETMLSNLKQKLNVLNPFADVQCIDLDSIQLTDVFDLNLFNVNSETVGAFSEKAETYYHNYQDEEHTHNHESGDEHHHHLEEITTFTLCENEPLDMNKLDLWMNELIMTYGMDLLRYKGILSLSGVENQVIFQGVNMAFKTETGLPWDDNQRSSTLVFIGKHLPVKDLTESFKKCVSSYSTKKMFF